MLLGFIVNIAFIDSCNEFNFKLYIFTMIMYVIYIIDTFWLALIRSRNKKYDKHLAIYQIICMTLWMIHTSVFGWINQWINVHHLCMKEVCGLYCIIMYILYFFLEKNRNNVISLFKKYDDNEIIYVNIS